MKLNIIHHEDDTTTIEGTRYSNDIFRQYGCNFPDEIGQLLKVVKKDDGLIEVVKILENNLKEEFKNGIE